MNRVRFAVLAIITAFGLVRIGVTLPLRATEIDFSHYYVASRLLLAGRTPYATSLVPAYEQYGFVPHPEFPTSPNPPPLLWVFAPVAALPPLIAFAVWVAVQVISLGAIFWLTRKLLGEKLSTWSWLGLIAITSISPVTLWHFGFSQVQLLLAALVLLAFYWQGAGRDTPACLAVAAAGLLKLYPFALLPWFIWRSRGTVTQRIWRALLVSGTVSVLVCATGLDCWQEYFRHGLPSVVSFAYGRLYNISLPSLITNLGAPSAIGLVIGTAFLGLVYYVCWRLKDDRETQFCLLCAGMLAGNVTAWGHYLVFLIFPFAVATARVTSQQSWPRMAGFIVLVGLINNFFRTERWVLPFREHQQILHVLVNYCPLFGLLGLIFFLIRTAPANDRYRGRCCTF